ncbi:hypothetical protein AMTRI_Chr09g41640 [Amborella trichopoda]|uniref:J domain-containing protein n=1 Tax=Amborella trichopoda TaxID=13333 RepID=W1PTM5_AMBTC|nr:hypothetical protein AMTR_s00041p00169040 [Amborella trichopoda]
MVSSSLPNFSSSLSLPSPSFAKINSRSLPMHISATYTSAERPPCDCRKVGTTSSLYEVLSLPSGASTAEIKAAYRRLVKLCHPDVAKDTSTNAFIKIHSADTTLSDPQKSADYDRKFALRPFDSSPLSPQTSSFRVRRTWETDQCW